MKTKQPKSHKLKFHRPQKNKADKAEPFFWPFELLSKEQSFSRARIVTWGYESSPHSGFFQPNNKQTVSQHGDDLLVDLHILRKIHVNPLQQISSIESACG